MRVRKRNLIFLLVAVDFLIFMAFIQLPAWNLRARREYREVLILADGYQLHGYLSFGEESESNWIIFVHGNRKAGQDHPLYMQMRNNFPRQYPVLALDLRGFGRSADTRLKEAPEILDRSPDLLAATRYLHEHYDVIQKNIILIGHSLGAAQVFHLAQNYEYQLVIPIGLGDWDGVLEDRTKMSGYIARFMNNTGVRMTMEQLQKEGSNFTSQALLSSCPHSPVWIIFAERDEARLPLYPDYLRLREACGDRLHWTTIPLADHVYGTELTWLPHPLRRIYSNLVVSILKWRLGVILDHYEP